MDITIKINEIDGHKSKLWYLWQDEDCLTASTRDTVLKEIEMEMKRAERNECPDLDLPQIY